MNAGQLRELVTIQTRTQTPTGGAGGSSLTEVYATRFKAWAAIRTQKGTDRIDAVNAGAGPTHHFVIRARPDIDASNFVLFDGRRFRILDLENIDERGRFLDLLAEELTDA